MQIDFKEYALSEKIEAAAKSAFTKALADFPDHSFFAFALTTLSNCEYVSSSLNSLENWQRVVAENDVPEDERAFYKWYANEWGEFEYFGQESGIWDDVDAALSAFEASIDARILSEFGLTEFPQSEADPFCNECAELNQQRRDYVLKAMIAALKRLDEQGVFGTGEIRKARILFVDVYDDENSADVRKHSVEALNANKANPSLLAEFDEVE